MGALVEGLAFGARDAEACGDVEDLVLLAADAVAAVGGEGVFSGALLEDVLAGVAFDELLVAEFIHGAVSPVFTGEVGDVLDLIFDAREGLPVVLIILRTLADVVHKFARVNAVNTAGPIPIGRRVGAFLLHYLPF